MQAFKELVNTRDDVKNIQSIKRFYLDQGQEVTIQREVILILLYMVEILTLFIGILKKKYIPF